MDEEASMVPERVEREVLIEAPVEVVWSVVTEPDHMARWLSDSVEIDPRAGGDAIFGWDEIGFTHARVERIEPPRLFAFSWVPVLAKNASQDVAEGNSTLVEFRLSEEGGGTRLRVVESGFDRLDGSAEANRTSAEDHLRGWERELSELLAYVAQEQASAGR
jgi:uncharacterized protein YndB with AHSA1/START domain